MSKTEKKKVGLTTRIFISLILGAIAGVLLHYFVPSGQIRDDIIINGIFRLCFVRLSAEVCLSGIQKNWDRSA